MKTRRTAIAAAVAATMAGLAATMDAAVQNTPFGIYSLRTSTRSTLGRGGIDTAQVQFSAGTMSGACLGQNGHPKGWAFGNYTTPILNRPRLQATNFTGQVQYIDLNNKFGRARGTLRVQRQANGKFRLSGSFRSVVNGVGTETTTFQGWQTNGF